MNNLRTPPRHCEASQMPWQSADKSYGRGSCADSHAHMRSLGMTKKIIHYSIFHF